MSDRAHATPATSPTSAAPPTTGTSEASPIWPAPPARRPVLFYLGYAGAAAGGALVGLAGSFLQAARGSVGAVPLPWGIVVALSASLAVFLGAGLLTRHRLGALAAGLGWLVAVGLLTVPRPEGDVVLAARDRAAYVWLYGGVALAALALAPAYDALARRLGAAPRAP